MPVSTPDPERQRLASGRDRHARWNLWGPYLAERQWGTVREDYSPNGDAWNAFSHDQARSRVYRWGEDGLLGISDSQARLCFALALWNGNDPILKERLFGLTGPEGNHGEDVKVVYFYLDATPTHSYLKALYRYPQRPFPYTELVTAIRRRNREQPEYELLDTGVFAEDCYFDVLVEYAKAAADDILIRINATNRGPDPATLHLLPTFWFRNEWAWGIFNDRPRPTLRAVPPSPIAMAERGRYFYGDQNPDPVQDHRMAGIPHCGAATGRPGHCRASGLQPPAESDPDGHFPHQIQYFPKNTYPCQIAMGEGLGVRVILATHDRLGDYWLACANDPPLLFTEIETNANRLWGTPNRTPYVKDAIHDAVVHDRPYATNPAGVGTKVAAHYIVDLAPAETVTRWLRLAAGAEPSMQEPFADVEAIMAQRISEADAFYAPLAAGLDDEARTIQRQAYAGLIWSKQFYYFDVGQWLDGDPAGPPAPDSRKRGRNANWRHLNNADVLSMPDTWEYPWYAAWDLAFHSVPFARIDPEFAKRQLVLLLREWYMHPNGQIPAYEWTFDDVNPPVIAWAAWRVYNNDARVTGRKDRAFLERVFHKLMMNFTWWVNRKDHAGRNVFQGGFLGLDNIGVFDRSKPLPTGGYLEQADGTAWMGMFSLHLMTIALELARENPVYEDIATKYFEHFLYIAGAMNDIGGEGVALWDDGDGFFYDVLQLPHGGMARLKVRSLVGLIPLLAVETLESELLDALPEFNRRLDWFLDNRPRLAELVSHWQEPGQAERHLLSLVREDRMRRLLQRMLDEGEFLSPYGIRSLSRHHAAEPFVFPVEDETHVVSYEPAESRTALFGGNSNWRGPIWFPLNYLLIEALREFDRYYGESLLVEHPTGSGRRLPLNRIADDLSARLVSIFRRGPDGRRPFSGDLAMLDTDPHWRDHLLFYEYFHGDTGAGLGASHQTGWTALVAPLLEASGDRMIHSTLARAARSMRTPR